MISPSSIINVTFSPKIAAVFRAKEVKAFVPVTAAELIWQEASEAEEDNESELEPG